MPITANELMEILEALEMRELRKLPRERLMELSGALYSAHVLAELAAGERRPFPAVVRGYSAPANDPAPAPAPPPAA